VPKIFVTACPAVWLKRWATRLGAALPLYIGTNGFDVYNSGGGIA